MHFCLKSRAAIVTGGMRGLGRVIAATLIYQGCKVMVTARNQPEEMNEAIAFHPANTRHTEPVDKLLEATANELGGIDIPVNNAGGSPESDAASGSPRFADAICFLTSDAARYISGARLNLDGGGEKPYFLDLVKGA